ncbi:MAG: hypothetical protein AAF821_16880 [Cyanobacteria bacterium P01_D01_bin.156]
MTLTMNAVNNYQCLKNVGRSTTSQTWVVRELHQENASLKILQKLELHNDDDSVVKFAKTLLHHKSHTLQTLFNDIDSEYKIHDYFSDETAFCIVHSMVKGQALHCLDQQTPLTGQQQLVQILRLLQQAYSWGLSSCCLHPSDLIYRQLDGGWVWTGMGVLKTVVQQVCKMQVSLAELFPQETAAYFAPECLQGKCNVSSDLYTVGVAIIQALTQLPLKDLVHGSDGCFTVRRGWYRQLNLPDNLVNVLSRMVNANAEKRYSTVGAVLQDCERIQA